MKRTFALTALLAGLLAFAACRAEPPGKPGFMATFSVHPGTTYQTITGFGAGFTAATEQIMAMITSPQDRARAYDLLYGESGARLNIVRLTISPSAKLIPSATFVGYDWAHDDGTQAEWRAIQPILHPVPVPGKLNLRRAKPVLYAVPFTPPAQWKDNGKLVQGSLLPANYHAYAEYLVGFLAYYHSLGADIDVLSVQNEPGVPAPWPSCIWTPAQMREFVKILAPMIHARGLNTKVMLSEGTNWSGAWAHLKPALDDPQSSPLVDVLASHSYQLSASDPFADPARSLFKQAWEETHKPVWMSEMSLMQPAQNDDPTMTAALKVARYIHLDMTEARASAWIYCFAIFVTIPPGMNHQLGSMGVLSPPDGAANGALVIPKRLWAMANYSRFARPGWKLMEIAGPNFANTGFVSPDGRSVAIVVVNPFSGPLTVHYDFGSAGIGSLKAYATTDSLDLGEITPPVAGPHGFTVTLGQRSVTTFTGALIP